jgi:hypothetical protein
MHPATAGCRLPQRPDRTGRSTGSCRCPPLPRAQGRDPPPRRLRSALGRAGTVHVSCRPALCAVPAEPQSQVSPADAVSCRGGDRLGSATPKSPPATPTPHHHALRPSPQPPRPPPQLHPRRLHGLRNLTSPAHHTTLPRVGHLLAASAPSCRRSQWVIATLHDLRFGGGMRCVDGSAAVVRGGGG